MSYMKEQGKFSWIMRNFQQFSLSPGSVRELEDFFCFSE